MNDGSEADIGDLVRRSQSGERGAFGDLFALTRRTVYGILRRMARSEEDALDLTQETYLQAWRSIASLRDPAAFRSWIYRIAANKGRDHLKSPRASAIRLDDRRDGEETVEIPDDGPGPSEIALSKERDARIESALESLSPDHRAVVAMHYVAGMEVSEIARVLGVKRGTVISRLSRARDALRKRLDPYMEETHELR